jgi:cob(I)alamin adenosyltransferase
MARAHSHGTLAQRLLELQRDLFVVAAELATEPTNRHKLEGGTSRVTEAMVTRVENWIDEVVAEVGMPKSFVVPGGNVVASTLDFARTVARRAERRCVGLADTDDLQGSQVVPYLNRLADYIYMLARAAESEWVSSKE